MAKQHDWFAASLFQKDLSTDDFYNLGITPDNTEIKSKDVYKNIPEVIDAFSNNGKFDDNVPKQAGNFKVTVRASGKGVLNAYLSTSVSPDGKLRGHKKRLPEEKFTLTDKEQEFSFEFSKKENELGYLYLRAKDAVITHMEIVKK